MAKTDKRYRVTMKGGDGKLVYVTVRAKDEEAAAHEAELSQMRRESRFPLTFARLDQAADSGQPGMIGIDPKFGGQALTEAWVNAEREKRKADQTRYEKGMKVVNVEENP